MVAAYGVRRSLLTGAAACVLLLGGLAGCGAETPTLAESARDTLHQDVDAIRDAAKDDPADAAAAVSRFRAHVNDLVAEGELDPADALQLITHAGRIETKLDAATTAAAAERAPATTSETAPITTTRQPITRVAEARPVREPEKAKEAEKDKGKGNGKGKDKGRGND